MRTPLGIVSEKKKALKMKFKDKQQDKKDGKVDIKKFAQLGGMNPFEFSMPKPDAEFEKKEKAEEFQ